MPYLPQSAACCADAGTADEAAMRAPKAAVERSNLIGRPPFVEMLCSPPTKRALRSSGFAAAAHSPSLTWPMRATYRVNSRGGIHGGDPAGDAHPRCTLGR